MENFEFRKLKVNEIKKAAMVLAESFIDYPLYAAFCPNKKKRTSCIYAFYLVSLRSRINYTYVTDDLTCIAVLKRPGDMPHGFYRWIFNPSYFFSVVRFLKIKTIKNFFKYSKALENFRKDKYDPNKDMFVEAICVKKEERDNLAFFKTVKANYKNERVYAETADKKLAGLYTFLGFKVTDSFVWNDITTYSIQSK